jgi:pimeloyl-ACP methyl ester carboxylesterase
MFAIRCDISDLISFLAWHTERRIMAQDWISSEDAKTWSPFKANLDAIVYTFFQTRLAELWRKMATQATVQIDDLDRAFGQAQTAYLARCAPGYRTRRLRCSAGQTQVIELGEGEPLLLLHGGGGHPAQWGLTLSPLAKRHRVLAIDRPGHGLADPFDYQGVDLLAHAHRFIADFLDAERLRSISIAANSAGGFFAFSFALLSPERVRHLALVGAPFSIARPHVPLPMRVVFTPIMKPVLRSIMGRPSRDRARWMWKRFLVAYPERLPDAFLDLEVANQRRNHSTMFTFMNRLFGAGGIKEEFILTDRWEKLSVPTTFIWGERDVTLPATVAQALAAKNGHFRFVQIPDVGHVPWFDNTNAVVDAINTAVGDNGSAHTD